eukprot:735875-Rhodomonas_salina.1
MSAVQIRGNSPQSNLAGREKKGGGIMCEKWHPLVESCARNGTLWWNHVREMAPSSQSVRRLCFLRLILAVRSRRSPKARGRFGPPHQIQCANATNCHFLFLTCRGTDWGTFS